MNDSIENQILETQEALNKDLLKAENNKAAARRARVATLKLEKLYKQFRKNSAK